MTETRADSSISCEYAWEKLTEAQYTAASCTPVSEHKNSTLSWNTTFQPRRTESSHTNIPVSRNRADNKLAKQQIETAIQTQICMLNRPLFDQKKIEPSLKVKTCCLFHLFPKQDVDRAILQSPLTDVTKLISVSRKSVGSRKLSRPIHTPPTCTGRTLPSLLNLSIRLRLRRL